MSTEQPTPQPIAQALNGGLGQIRDEIQQLRHDIFSALDSYVRKDTCEAKHESLPSARIWLALGGLAVIQAIVVPTVVYVVIRFAVGKGG